MTQPDLERIEQLDRRLRLGNWTLCPQCGLGVVIDEEGLCSGCGATASGPGVIRLVEALRIDLPALLQAARTLAAVEMKYRTVLWLGHGHVGIYSDDGEMQCAMCAPTFDYKRMPLEAVEAAADKAKMERVAELLSGTPDAGNKETA